MRIIYFEAEDGERFAFVLLIEPELEDGITFEFTPPCEVDREELPA